MKNRRWPYLLLALLFSITVAYQARFSAETVRDLSDPASQAEAPFFVSRTGFRVRGVRPEAHEAGLRDGDTMVAVDGKPFRGFSSLAVPVAAHRPGDGLVVRVQRGEQEIDLTVRLVPDTGGRLQGIGGAAFSLWRGVAMPWFCLLAGFWVALARPRDLRAWLVLALMLSYAHLARSPNLMAWEDGLRPLAVGVHEFWNSTWALWILLFGLYFPETFAWERRHRWAKWIVILPFCVLAILNAASAVAASEDHRLARIIESFMQPYRRVLFSVNVVPITLFLASLGVRWITERKPDSRRRLTLLLAGSIAGMGPMMALMIRGLIYGRSPAARVDPGFLLLALAMQFLFPVTLAYVIAVQRAMDIRVVLRQSVQYALAKRGLWLARVALGVLIIWWAISLTGREGLNTFETLALGGVATAAVIATQRASERAAGLIDRRFFRESYNAEQILAELADEVRTMIDERRVVETVARRIGESLHAPRVSVLLSSDPAVAGASGVTGHLRQTRRSAYVYPDDPASWVHGLGDEDRRLLGDLGAQLLVPLAVKDRLMGFISLGPKRSEEPYSRTDLRLLETVAAQAALALENSQLAAAVAADAVHRERLSRELEIAREVQQRLLPQTLPEIAGLDYAGICRPALGVGGDYYDFLALPDGNLGIAVGDVSGKGVPAALLMASLQASLRGQAILGSTDLATLMSNLNRLICDATQDNRFATFFYGQYEPRTRRLTYVNAGHDPPMLFRGAEVIRLETGGMIVGWLPDAVYTQQTLELEPGDLLVAFTDGISEAQNADQQEWGEQRLMEVAARARDLPAEDLLRHILAEADAFVAGAPQYDDMTLVAARIRPASNVRSLTVAAQLRS
jgi:sigma-B regulation protein RsbU (phosphoserine phosphatase)